MFLEGDEEIVEDIDEEVEDEAPEGDDIPAGDEGKGKDDPYKDLTPEQLKERLKTAEQTIVKNKQKAKPPVKNPKPQGDEVPEWGKSLLSDNAKRQFGSDKGMSPEAVDAVFKYNGGTAPTNEQLENDTALRSIVRGFKSKERVAGNTPNGGSQPTYKGKTYAETATDKDASPQDKQAAFEATKKRHSGR